MTGRYTNPSACGVFFCVSSQTGTTTQRPVASSFVYHHRPVHQPSGLWLLLLCIITGRYTNPAACGFFFCVSSQAGTPTQRTVASSFVYHHRPVHQPSGLWLLLLCIITGRYTNPAACGFFFCVSSQAGTPTQRPVASSFVYHHRPVHQPSGLWLLPLCIITGRYTNPAACGFFFCVSSQAGTPTQQPVASSFVYHHRPVHQPSGLWRLLLCIVIGRYTNPAACGFFFCVQ